MSFDKQLIESRTATADALSIIAAELEDEERATRWQVDDRALWDDLSAELDAWWLEQDYLRGLIYDL
jgi:hypothetical protein